MKFSTANKLFMGLAFIDAVFFGMDLVRGTHPGWMLAEGFVGAFCALGAVTNWDKA